MVEKQNFLYTNDNLHIMHGMNSESVDLIYLDLPFNSKRTYSAPIGSKAAGTSFKDMWTWDDFDEACLYGLVGYENLIPYIEAVGNIQGRPTMAYLTYMAQRLIEMRRLLKPTGSVYLHCDPTASHYLKGIMDIIFGKENLRNEIVWCYHGPGSPHMRQFNRKTDHIFWYSKGEKWTFNKDDVRLAYKDSKQALRRAMSTTGTFSDEEVEEYRSRGKVPENWWVMRIAARSKTEYIGYPTQKPLALLRRIIKASSNEGDMVLDPFCGCATTCVAAQQLNRRWIGIDIEEQAVDLLMERLKDDAGLFEDFTHLTEPPIRSDVETVVANRSVKKKLYSMQDGKCNGCDNEYYEKDMEIDHIIPKSRGGGDFMENYQLLCGNCNRTKGNRPMEFLRMQIEKRRKRLRTYITFGKED